MDSSTARSDTSENVFFFVLFHHSIPLEYEFMCQIFIRCSETWNSFQERHILQACKFTVKKFILDAVLVFSSGLINSFLWDQLMVVYLEFLWVNSLRKLPCGCYCLYTALVHRSLSYTKELINEVTKNLRVAAQIKCILILFILEVKEFLRTY